MKQIPFGVVLCGCSCRFHRLLAHQTPRFHRSPLRLPAGDVKIGNLDYHIYSNAQLNRRTAAQKRSTSLRVAISPFSPMRTAFVFFLAALFVMNPSGVSASPATFVTALPVAKNQGLFRFNAEPGFGPSGYRSLQFPVNFAYGATPNWSLFITANQGILSLDHNPSTFGAGNTVVFVRNTLFKIDKPRSTFRIAPLAGASLPTGQNRYMVNGTLAPGSLQSGSGTVDPYAGVTFGYNNSLFGAAWDATYLHNPAASAGFTPGSQFDADGEMEIRLFPFHLPEEGLPSNLVLSIEGNYQDQGISHVNGLPTVASANKTYKQDAIFEWATLHWEFGAGEQISVMQDYETPHPIAQHSRTYIFLEYYVSMPSWRRRGQR